jgi:4-amino-4-deoxy-L-arabinose transferase-like glycosyltransferase
MIAVPRHAASGVHPRSIPGLSHGFIALLVGVIATMLLLLSAPSIGLTWDEPSYIVAGESYIRWFGRLVRDPAYAFSDPGIMEYWGPNHEHPPLAKVWSGAFWVVSRSVLDDLTAHRLGPIILAGILAGLLYHITARDYGHVAGLSAAAAAMTMPRFFFHAHLIALDVPAAIMMFLVVYVFWLTRTRRGLRWTIALGVAWGLALATKFNAISVLPILGLWTLIFERRWALVGRLFGAAMIGLATSLALWPWMYHDTFNRVKEYTAYITVEHSPIPQWYLGRLHQPPPWHFPFVMLLVVVPATLTLLYMLSIVRALLGGRRQAFAWLMIFNAIVPCLLLTSGKTFVYDNERLFIAAFPYLAVLAGLGFGWVVEQIPRITRRLRRPSWSRPLALAIALVAFVPHILHAATLYPHLLSYYSEAIGGVSNATRLGFETTYWSETYREALPYLNRNARPNDVIWVQYYSYDVMLYYQQHGLLRRDLFIVWPPGSWTPLGRYGLGGMESNIEDADYVVLQYRQTGFSDESNAVRHGSQPVFQVSRHGVPLLEIYKDAD